MFNNYYELSNGNEFGIFIEDGYYFKKTITSGGETRTKIDSVVSGVANYCLIFPAGKSRPGVWPAYAANSTWVFFRYGWALDKVFGNVSSSLSLDVAETITIPEGLTDSQSIALDVGATQSMEIQDIFQGILDAILAGDLAASAEIVDTADVPVDPEEPDPPVVPVVPSGLDKLGAALTSRFPFSIPWDIKKGVTLLAAPPKAPYFEVDFMAPIAYRVGGWKGSTKIVLDFSEYEIIGQVCRWTSTIGFCLMLASGTKRLIWTA